MFTGCLQGALRLAPELCRYPMTSESAVECEYGHVFSGSDKDKANESIFGD